MAKERKKDFCAVDFVFIFHYEYPLSMLSNESFSKNSYIMENIPIKY